MHIVRNNALLMLGNGFSIDLSQYLRLSMHPSHPFKFDIPDPFERGSKLLDRLSRVKRLIEMSSGKEDFDVIQGFIENYNSQEEQQKQTHFELRQYLSMAYSHFSRALLDN